MPEMPQRTILLVEDDPTLAMGLCDSLEFEGFRVTHTDRGTQAVALAREKLPDCIILDLMLPDMNGYQVCEEIRRLDQRVPILMLTARSQEADKIRGLDAGADDYVAKPFSIGELVARLRAMFRRASLQDNTQQPFQVGEALVDPGAHTLTRGRETVTLSFYEAGLLKLLHEHRGCPVSRDEILDKIWGLQANPSNRTVDNVVVKLRKKIEPNQDRPRYILTVYGLGYKLAGGSTT